MRKIVILAALIGNSAWALAQMADSGFRAEDFYKAKAKALSSQIVNFPELAAKRQKTVLSSLADWEKLSDSLGIGPGKRLPATLLCLTDSSREYNLVPDYDNICYEPNIDLPYQIAKSLWKTRLELSGELSFLEMKARDLPRPSTLLAILARETWMIGDTLGDGGRSIGMCQLHAQTAAYIISDAYPYNRIFRRFIEPSAAETGKPAFRFKGLTLKEQQQSMVDFLVRFMIVCKRYRSFAPESGIRRYNGGGQMAKDYALDVLRRIAAYDAFLARSPMPVGFDVRELQSDPESVWFISPSSGLNSEALTPADRRFHYERFRKEFEFPEQRFCRFKGIDGQDRFIRFCGAQSGADSSLRCYIRFDSERTLFSYFRGELWEAVAYHNRCSLEKIELFYYHDNVIQPISSAQDFEAAKGQVFSKRLRARQKIYLRPQSWVYMYDGSGRAQRITVYLEPLAHRNLTTL